MQRSYIGIAGDCGHNSAVAVLGSDGVRYAEAEERLSRIKGEGRFPVHALKCAKNFLRPNEEAVLCFVGKYTLEACQPNGSDDRGWRDAKWTEEVSKLTKDSSEFYLVEHHVAHAYSAHFLSGGGNGLCISADGQGDGVAFFVGCFTATGNLEELHSTKCSVGSLGYYYAAVTRYLGFRTLCDEGKVMALAGHGCRESQLSALFEQILSVSSKGEILVNSNLIRQYTEEGPFWTRRFDEACQNYAPAMVAHAAQRRLNEVVCEVLKYWLRRTGERRVLAAGGIFANVSLNRQIQELSEVDKLFITPCMSDEGTAIGAAVAVSFSKGEFPEIPTGHGAKMSLGSCCEVRPEDINNVAVVTEGDGVEDVVAELLAQKAVVARVVGRMEFGPRALGNRSILCHASDKDTIFWLNNMLGRSNLMPFAPAILSEQVRDYVIVPVSTAENLAHMTTSVVGTLRLKNECPGVVHIDGTVRPYVVTRVENPGLHRILFNYGKRTGTPVIINTSFNLHGSPIVNDAVTAIQTCMKSGIPYLQLDRTLMRIV